MVPHLSPELQQEYHRLINRNNNLMFLPSLNVFRNINLSLEDDFILPLHYRDIFNEISQLRNADLSEEFEEFKYNKLQLVKYKYTKERNEEHGKSIINEKKRLEENIRIREILKIREAEEFS